ncbi:hypothetical protein DPMN_184640 [Dreissena polymorpha]|nr:hypothetical protein DPMN_184640 [Dreissena polymorpha]
MVVVVMMVFVMINAGDQSPQGRIRGITFDYPKGFLRKVIPTRRGYSAQYMYAK